MLSSPSNKVADGIEANTPLTINLPYQGFKNFKSFCSFSFIAILFYILVLISPYRERGNPPLHSSWPGS